MSESVASYYWRGTARSGRCTGSMACSAATSWPDPVPSDAKERPRKLLVSARLAAARGLHGLDRGLGMALHVQRREAAVRPHGQGADRGLGDQRFDGAGF